MSRIVWRKFFALFMFIIIWPVSSLSLADVTDRVLLLDRISLALTGKPASLKQKQDLVDEQRSLQEIIEDFRDSPGFEKKLARYWMEVLRIDQPFNFENMVSLENKTMLRHINPSSPVGNLVPHHGSHASCGVSRADTYIYRYGNHPNSNLQSTTDDNIVIDGVTYKDALYDCGCKYYLNGQGGYSANDVVNGQCTRCDNIVDVRPYWDPTTIVKACSLVVHPNYCGPDLSNCWPDDHPYTFMGRHKILENLNYSFSMEPGILIAKIVKDNLSWNEVLTTTKTVINGTLAWVLARDYGRPFIEKFAPRSQTQFYFPDRLNDPTFTKGKVSDYENFKFVEASPLASGVLTTPAFHMATNGRRAKANRVYESFLCREFVAPNLDIEDSDETDLTKRPYCRFCHATLEPLADFFNRWPEVGTNYVYNPAVLDQPNPSNPSAKHAYGTFEGQSGTDTKALGEIIVGLPAYSQCAVRRAFDFVMGRPMNKVEASELLEPLTEEFNANGKRLWPIIVKISTSATFAGSVEK